MKFTYDINSEGKIQTVRMNGRILDTSETEDMMEQVSKNIEDGQSQLIFNLKDLDYMNSSGLNILINLLTKSRNHYGEMVLCELSDNVEKLLITSKLQNIFKIAENEAEAKKLLN